MYSSIDKTLSITVSQNETQLSFFKEWIDYQVRNLGQQTLLNEYLKSNGDSLGAAERKKIESSLASLHIELINRTTQLKSFFDSSELQNSEIITCRIAEICQKWTKHEGLAWNESWLFKSNLPYEFYRLNEQIILEALASLSDYLRIISFSYRRCVEVRYDPLGIIVIRIGSYGIGPSLDDIQGTLMPFYTSGKYRIDIDASLQMATLRSRLERSGGYLGGFSDKGWFGYQLGIQAQPQHGMILNKGVNEKNEKFKIGIATLDVTYLNNIQFAFTINECFSFYEVSLKKINELGVELIAESVDILLIDQRESLKFDLPESLCELLLISSKHIIELSDEINKSSNSKKHFHDSNDLSFKLVKKVLSLLKKDTFINDVPRIQNIKSGIKKRVYFIVEENQYFQNQLSRFFEFFEVNLYQMDDIPMVLHAIETMNPEVILFDSRKGAESFRSMKFEIIKICNSQGLRIPTIVLCVSSLESSLEQGFRPNDADFLFIRSTPLEALIGPLSL